MSELNNESDKNNVLSLFGARSSNEKSSKDQIEQNATPEGSDPFAEAMRRNEENRKRMMKERLKANKGVLRSYRIKH
ncbi:MAG: hypothetical protein R3B45_01690 [Bdellovibrionota bacterium]